MACFQNITCTKKMKNKFETNKKQRIEWIDAAKAVAIICIVLGHAVNGNGILWHIVYGFHIPLFIILGGLIFSVRVEKFQDFVIRKFKSIMIPYYFWGIISIFIYLIMTTIIHEKDSLNIYQCFVGLIVGTAQNGKMHWNTPMWYLPMYFCMQSVSFVWVKCKQSNKTLLVYGISSFVFAWLIYFIKPDIYLPFGIASMIFLYPFFVFGVWLKKVDIFFEQLSKVKRVFVACALMVISGVGIIYQDNIDYVTNVYRSYPIFYFSAIGMSLGIIVIIKETPKHSNLIKTIGLNTLGIMILQKFPLFFLIHVCPVIKNLYHTNILVVSIISTCITVLVCTAVCVYCTKYWPWMFGKKVYKEWNKGKR